MSYVIMVIEVKERGKVMSNKEMLLSLIEEANDNGLNSEIEYHMECGTEKHDAFDDAYTFSEENNERKLLKVCRTILIKAGYFIEEEKCETGRDTRFTLNKKKYGCITYWEGWINA